MGRIIRNLSPLFLLVLPFSKNLRTHHPEIWNKLLDMDKRAIKMFGTTPLGSFRKGYTVQALEERFTSEAAAA